MERSDMATPRCRRQYVWAQGHRAIRKDLVGAAQASEPGLTDAPRTAVARHAGAMVESARLMRRFIAERQQHRYLSAQKYYRSEPGSSGWAQGQDRVPLRRTSGRRPRPLFLARLERSLA